jgi:hypothetical protein
MINGTPMRFSAVRADERVCVGFFDTRDHGHEKDEFRRHG